VNHGDMITIKTLNAGQPGTKKWIKKYGNDLVCIRYKYDTRRNRRIKTVELIAEIAQCDKSKKRIPDNKIMQVHVNYEEIQLQRLIKNAGGVWNRGKKVWELPYREVKALDLYERITEY